MTSNTDGAAQGEWHEWERRETLVADWDFWQIWEKGIPGETRIIADFLTEADADRILAEHRKAQTAVVLAEALEALADDTTSSAWGMTNKARAALAQFHAAAQGEWLYDNDLETFAREVEDGDGYEELRADHLNELERKAQLADVLVKALEDVMGLAAMYVARTVQIDPTNVNRIEAARAALAQYYVATEETTRP